MEIVYECCCGLDVHAQTVVACLRQPDQKERRTFSTMTEDVLRLADWLLHEGCTPVAIESTGVSWKPVFNILAGLLAVLLVNARHVKAVPGHKTDARDSAWFADLLRHGLLKASFIPPRPLRDLRELPRYRQSVLRDQRTLANRLQTVIESGHIKLGQVASEALGVRGRAMLRAVAAGATEATAMADLARQSLTRKKPEGVRALDGRLTEPHRWVLGEWLARDDALAAALGRVAAHIRQAIEANPDPCVAAAVGLLDTIPGGGAQVAQTIGAEMGVEMSRFPSAGHLASGAGLGPGNNASAGTRRSGKTTQGSPYLRTVLVQAAWAASHSRGTSLAGQYHRLVKRMGKKKARVAVAHSMLVIVYPMLSRRPRYAELGESVIKQRSVHAQSQRLIRQREALGCKITVEEPADAA
jgi:transposase